MIKARQSILRISPEQAHALREVQLEAARCWNDILDRSKEHFRQSGKWIGKGDLQKLLKKKYKLHSQTVQALTDKYVSNRETAAALRKKGVRCSYPWRNKKYLTIPFKQMAIKTSVSGTLVLTLSAGERFDTGIILPRPANTCEILWRRDKYALSWASEYPEAEPASSGLRAGIDMGEIHPVAVTAENGHGIIISGREIRSVKQLRNKSLAWFSRAISRCKKGSGRMKKLFRAKGRLKAKSNAQIRDLVHQATRKAINWCSENGVADILIGDLTGVEQNTRKNKRLGRNNRQKVSQMEYGRIRQYLRYKAKETGIRTADVKEDGTTKKCPACGTRNKTCGRLYSCGCGFACHRDGKSAFMMIRAEYPDIPLPEKFIFRHQQAFPMYRKQMKPACVDGPDVAQSSLVIAQPLCVSSLSAA